MNHASEQFGIAWLDAACREPIPIKPLTSSEKQAALDWARLLARDPSVEHVTVLPIDQPKEAAVQFRVQASRLQPLDTLLTERYGRALHSALGEPSLLDIFRRAFEQEGVETSVRQRVRDVFASFGWPHRHVLLAGSDYGQDLQDLMEGAELAHLTLVFHALAFEDVARFNPNAPRLFPRQADQPFFQGCLPLGMSSADADHSKSFLVLGQAA